MKAHIYYIIFGRPFIEGGEFLPLAAPLSSQITALPNKQTDALRALEDQYASRSQTQAVRVAVAALQGSHAFAVVTDHSWHTVYRQTSSYQTVRNYGPFTGWANKVSLYKPVV